MLRRREVVHGAKASGDCLDRHTDWVLLINIFAGETSDKCPQLSDTKLQYDLRKFCPDIMYAGYIPTLG